MEIRNSRAPSRAPAADLSHGSPIFEFLISILALSIFPGGCASPGEPIERRPPVPQAVTDLAARQSGNDVVLTFTLPTETVDRRPLDQLPAIEIYKGVGNAGTSARVALTLVATIPSAAVDRYVAQGHVRYADSLKPEDFAQSVVAAASYAVRTRASAKKESDESNVVDLPVHVAADPIGDVKAEITQPAVVLTWTPPQRTLVGPAPPIAVYRIYRAEAEAGAAGTTGENVKLKSPLAKIGESESASFRDAQFEFGKTYVYSVRSVIQPGGEALESADSNALAVTPKDTFPPAAPQGLVLALVPSQGEVAAHVELSWAISPEADIAGYNAYRTEQPGAPGTRLNTELLLTPAFRDMNMQPGRRYFYTVTAVDRSGNESSPSEAVSGGVPAEGQVTP